MRTSALVAVVALVLTLSGCGSSGGGDDSGPSFTQFTPGGYPVVAGDYTVTARERTNDCAPVDTAPDVSTYTITQNEGNITVIDHGEAADRAALEAAGYTINSLSPMAGTVTVDGHFSLSQGITMTHASFGSVNGATSIDGVFTPTGGSGTQETIFLYPDLGSSCRSTSSISAKKNP